MLTINQHVQAAEQHRPLEKNSSDCSSLNKGMFTSTSRASDEYLIHLVVGNKDLKYLDAAPLCVYIF